MNVGPAAVLGQRRARRTSMLAVATTVAALGGLAGATPAVAVDGDPVTGSTYDFVANVDIGTGADARSCTGALVVGGWELKFSKRDTDKLPALIHGRPYG